MWWIFVCKWPLCCHIVRDGKQGDISQSGGEEAESRMSTGGSRCRKRNERSPNMRGLTAVSKGLLHLVHKCWCDVFPVDVCFKSPITLAFSSPSLVLFHSCPLSPFITTAPHPPTPKTLTLAEWPLLLCNLICLKL